VIAVNQSAKQVTPSKEDYLKAIWKVSEVRQQSEASTGDLAEALQVSPPAVSRMMKQMEQQELVAHTPYYGARLTEKGRKIALKTIRRHRLLELFLAETLGYSLHAVHAEAERLEHHISEEFEARIDALLGYPRRCPHGSPIPNDEGQVSPLQGQLLSEIESPSVLRIERVHDTDADLLAYLCASGLVPQTMIRLIHKEPFAGDLKIEVGQRRMRLSSQAAKSLIVSKQ